MLNTGGGYTSEVSVVALKYDFEMFTVIPEDQQIRVEAEGLPRELAGRKIALFRDPLTAAALRKASGNVQAAFLEAGFGFNVYDSGAPEGRFPEEDTPDRDNVLMNLGEKLDEIDLEASDFGGFNLNDFLDHLHSASPIEVETFQFIPTPAGFPSRSIGGLGIGAAFATIMAFAVSTVF
jgi:hypothetical protein